MPRGVLKIAVENIPNILQLSGYKALKAAVDQDGRTINVLVESDDIPAVEVNVELPLVVPEYEYVNSGIVALKGVTIR